MKRLLVALGLIAAVAVPVTAAAKPTKTDRKNAARECKAERGGSTATRETFKTRYRTFGKCLSRRARDEAAERKVGHTNAAKECKAEWALNPAAFEDKYGTNHNKKNAFGKRVSGKAKAKEAAMDAKDRKAIRARKHAAKECAEEREGIGREAFAAKYGTNHNKRNAFGKCVSAQSGHKS
jgi:hypothetical protein